MPEEIYDSNQKEIDFQNISKVANVEVMLTAELGRADITLKDAIECDKDSVIVLDKANNEPVDTTNIADTWNKILKNIVDVASQKWLEKQAMFLLSS